MNNFRKVYLINFIDKILVKRCYNLDVKSFYFFAWLQRPVLVGCVSGGACGTWELDEGCWVKCLGGLPRFLLAFSQSNDLKKRICYYEQN